MSVLSAILQHQRAQQAVQPAAALPKASATSAAPASSASSAAAGAASSTISANDFLTLLVTEMQNQDPTADTDPNEYINQLVQVNSLEQLIDINQTLTTAYPASTTSSSTPQSASAATTGSPSALATSHASSAKASRATKSNSALAVPNLQPTAGNSLRNLAAARSPRGGASNASKTPLGAGDFTIPAASPAAFRVANSLGGKSSSPQSSSTPDYSGR